MKYFLILLIAFSTNSFSQNITDFKVPAGYQIKDFNDKEGAKINGDFDHDGKTDLATIYYAENPDDINVEALSILVIYLNKKYQADSSYQWIEWHHMVTDLYFVNNILTVSSIDNGRFTSLMDFKYDSATNQMKILKYEEDGIRKKNEFNLKSKR